MNNLWAIATLSTTIFLGELFSCSNVHNSVTHQPADSQVNSEIRIGSQGSTYLAMKTLTDAYISQVKNVQISFVPMTQSTVALKGVRNGLLDLSSVDEELKFYFKKIGFPTMRSRKFLQSLRDQNVVEFAYKPKSLHFLHRFLKKVSGVPSPNAQMMIHHK
ncbi:hypothetical protein [Scytonema sp. NUACC26]|uniref:hypothetical protein n=1 Tax=Scytonema sp. NUACC26 TaxID=3140176 RepID=UPI0034DB7ED1